MRTPVENVKGAGVKVNITVSGGPEIEAALKDLGSKIAGRLGENAVRAGARVIASHAKAKAPISEATRIRKGVTIVPGALRKSIRAFQDTERRAGQRIAYAGSRLFYAKFVEFGVPHAAAQPFLRPAADESGQEVRAKVAENLARGIEREKLKGSR